MLAHLRDLVAATDLPVNADFESGFASDAQGVHESVRLAVETGVASLSIEDRQRRCCAADPPAGIDARGAPEGRARAIDEAGGGEMLVGRAENFLAGSRIDLDDTTARLKAYADGGRRLPLCAGHPHAPSRSRPWWPPWRPSRSTCWSARPAR